MCWTFLKYLQENLQQTCKASSLPKTHLRRQEPTVIDILIDLLLFNHNFVREENFSVQKIGISPYLQMINLLMSACVQVLFSGQETRKATVFSCLLPEFRYLSSS